VYGCHLNDGGVAYSAEMNSRRFLEASENLITDTGALSLAKSTSLRGVLANTNKIGSCGQVALSLSENPITFDVSGTPEFSLPSIVWPRRLENWGCFVVNIPASVGEGRNRPDSASWLGPRRSWCRSRADWGGVHRKPPKTLAVPPKTRQPRPPLPCHAPRSSPHRRRNIHRHLSCTRCATLSPAVNE